MQFVARFGRTAITTEVVGRVSFDNQGYPSNPYQLISFPVTPSVMLTVDGWLLTVDSEQSTVNSELEFTIPMLTDLIGRTLQAA